MFVKEINDNFIVFLTSFWSNDIFKLIFFVNIYNDKYIVNSNYLNIILKTNCKK